MSKRLELKHISKRFGQETVLHDVSLSLGEGQVLALMGENGAGKSTLMNILCGAYQQYQGEIYIAGVQQQFATPKDAENAGVVMVHQELNLLPELSIAENIFLGAEPRNRFGLINSTLMRTQANELLKQLGLNISSQRPLKELPLGQQQVVEIARALARQAKLLILDEPSAALSDSETQRLFALVRKLAEQGVAVVYISHRLEELAQIASHAAVLRNGKIVAQGAMSEFSPEQLIELMIGEELQTFFPEANTQNSHGGFALNIQDLRCQQGHSPLSGIDLQLKTGEILGLSGLLGSGCGELLRCLFGELSYQAKQFELFGHATALRTPKQAIDAGVAFISEDRKSESLVLEQSLEFNLELPGLCQSQSSLLKKQPQQWLQLLRQLGVKHHSAEQAADSLSGGNQQKLALARWLPLQPKLLLLNEPTRGVDVGAKAEIYRLLMSLREQGISLIIASTDLAEVMALSDRLLILHQGRIAHEMTPEEYSQADILSWAQGRKPTATPAPENMPRLNDSPTGDASHV